ncbi:hypothetical protein [Nonomuraea sp. GTA35]|uniref:hypothetical protein n=1 Tax=Nonomuraea sp. GTA35 TaxID=1676746 RepID=UPI0035BFC717
MTRSLETKPVVSSIAPLAVVSAVIATVTTLFLNAGHRVGGGGRVEVTGVPGTTVFTPHPPASREQVAPGESGAAGDHEPGGHQGERGGGHETG